MSAKKGSRKPKKELLESSEQPSVVTPINLREKFVNEQLSRSTKMTFWLYIGMTILLAAIVFFWGFSLWSNITSFDWKKTPESKMITGNKTDINKIFQTTQQNELQNQLTKLQIKELLNRTLYKTPAPTTSTTSTANSEISTSTTSTLITTSTIVTTTKK